MKIFDMNCIGTRNDEKRGKARLEKIPKINVNKSLKSIVFNTCAFETLELIDKGVRFELEDDGTWYVVADSSEKGITLSAHRGSYYFTSMVLTRTMLSNSKQNRASYILLREGHRWRLEDATKYQGEVNTPSLKSNNNNDDLEMKKQITQAQRILRQYQQSDFPGRIKTNQVIASERLLATSR